MALLVSPSYAVPLLQVDFGAPLPHAALQAGFQGMWGTNDHPTTATLGTYTVELSANSSMTGTQSSRGFFDKLSGFGGRIDNVDIGIRDFYRDFFFNRSTINGEGIDLKISGLTPNHTYTLTLTSYDADATNNPAAFTPQVWAHEGGQQYDQARRRRLTYCASRGPPPCGIRCIPAYPSQYLHGGPRHFWDDHWTRHARNRFKRLYAQRWHERCAVG